MYSPVENLNSHANRKYTPRCLGVQFATRDREREREREREQASNLIEAIKMPSSQCLCNLLSKWNGFQPQSNSKATPTLDAFLSTLLLLLLLLLSAFFFVLLFISLISLRLTFVGLSTVRSLAFLRRLMECIINSSSWVSSAVFFTKSPR